MFQQLRSHADQHADHLEGYLDQAMQAPEYEYASHPALATRIHNLPPSTATQIEPEDAVRMELESTQPGWRNPWPLSAVQFDDALAG